MNEIFKEHCGHELDIYREEDHYVLQCKTCGCKTLKIVDAVDPEEAKQARLAARNIYGGDDAEIDDDAIVSSAEDGCWVQGWLWLADFDLSNRPKDATPAGLGAGPAAKAVVVEARSVQEETDLLNRYAKRLWGLGVDQIRPPDPEALAEVGPRTDVDAFVLALAQVLLRHMRKSAQGGK